MHVHFIYHPADQNKAYLEDLLDQEIQPSYGKEIPQEDEISILVAGRPQAHHFENHPSIHTLIIPWAQLPPETTEVLKSFPEIKVHNIHHNAAPAAELALALLLAVAKEILPHDQTLRAGNWSMRYRESDSQLLGGKTALVLGFGEIGKLIKRYLTALGVEVLAVKRTAAKADQTEMVYPPSMISELLPRAEILILALPLTPDTEGLISKKGIDLLPSNAILINISRAVIVDQKALYDALKSRRIYGAGLDVWYTYPQSEDDRLNTNPADFPFAELENVVMSPHRGGKVDATEKMRMEGVASLLNAAAAGKPIPNPVDLSVGY
jgi:phosphoglycerate dehydrogenase-like enzyme